MAGEPFAEMITRAPAPQLRPFVDAYVGYRLAGFPASIHRGLPSRHMTFIVSIGDPIEVIAQTDPSQSPGTYECVLSGLQASPALIAEPGDSEGVEIELTPFGARVLFGMPARELWDLTVELSDVAGAIAVELRERIGATTSWEGRFAVCDEVLSRMATGVPPPDELARSWRMLVASGGSLPIGHLASATGYSRQHLTRMFRREFGLGPKLAARVIRFERARAMLGDAARRRTIADVAAACGYADHAHLVRDIHDLAGCTPSELAGEAVPFVQDDATAVPAQWGA